MYTLPIQEKCSKSTAWFVATHKSRESFQTNRHWHFSYPTFTTAYHPRTNGLVEHCNGTLATMLSMYVSTDQTDSDTYVNLITFNFNCFWQETTRVSQFLLGREPKSPTDIALGDHNGEKTHVEIILRRIKKTFGCIGKHRNRTRAETKIQYGLTSCWYDIGDQVLVLYSFEKEVQVRLHRWFGPYEIVDKPNNFNYKIKILKNGDVVYDTVHVGEWKNST